MSKPENRKKGKRLVHDGHACPVDHDQSLCPYAHDRESLMSIAQKVDELVSEVIEGNQEAGRLGHIKRTNLRLDNIEKKQRTQLSEENVEFLNKVINVVGSHRFFFGMLATTILAAVGAVRLLIELWNTVK